MTEAKSSEASFLKGVREELARTHSLTDPQRESLAKIFEKRFPQALALVDGKKVTSYRFRPSGRTVWIVKGRRGEYEVMPDSMFCTCDDYYFRVMDNKKQLCYHLIAQQLASGLGQFDHSELSDSRYAELAAKWSEKAPVRRS